MQISPVMNEISFDALSVSMDAAVSLGQRVRLIGAFLASQVSPLFGGPPPGAEPAPTSRPCIDVNYNGECWVEIGVKTPVSGFKPSVNGCGSASGWKFPNGRTHVSWRWACDKHDRCYTNCTTAKATCDKNLETDIVNTCKAGYPGLGNLLEREICHAIANVYFIGVDDGGMGPWIQGQKDGCRCCRDCESGLRACGTQCCDDSEICCAGQCIDWSTKRCCLSVGGEYICAGNQTCCGNGSCCDAGSTCCLVSDTARACVPYGNSNCGECIKCGTGQECCIKSNGVIAGCCEVGRCHPERGCT